MNNCKALVIGGSAGSLDVLLKVLPGVNPLLSFPIIIVIHRKPGNDSMLADLLKTKTDLPVKEIEEKDVITHPYIYIAPPNYHLLLENNLTFSLDASEKVNFSRPSIDVTFESASEIFGEDLVCLLLSGANSDGTIGLQKVKKNGGITAVQNVESAIVPFMPEYALEHAIIDDVVTPEEMVNYINQLSNN